jgi:DNA polymerase I
MGLKIRDTGIELFLTQLNPQGLKRSAKRLAGMSMRDYEDVVGPVAERFLRDHLLSAIAEPPASWGLGDGRKWSILKRVEGMIYPRKTAGTESRSLREKWADEDFAPIRAQIEASIGPAPRPAIDDIPREEFRDYACADADGTRRQSYPLRGLMDQNSLWEIHHVDHGVIPIVDRMQQVGLRVDVQRLDELRDYVQGELNAYLEICKILTGDEDLNPASGDQIAAWCSKMDLGLTKLTKSGKRIQVDENALIAIRYAHPAIEAFLTYRELDKLRGTYIEPLYGLLVGAGRYRRLYGHFRLTAAITGRLAMFDPNLMAFPTRTEVGRRLRRCFVAGPGHRIGSCDLSQIELRVGAALSQDERMVDAFQRDADIHLETAVSMFDLPAALIDELLHRYPAKTTNFAMFFGAKGRRLFMEFLKAGIPGWTEERCDGFVEKWFDLYSGVRGWIDATCEQGARDGYVRTASGRMRYLPALRFKRDDYPFNRIREEAQRHASNFPVQGTAQEIEKRGMKVVWDEVIPAVQAAGFYFEPLLQIHDELLVEMDIEAEEIVKDLMLEAMTRETPFRGVPIKASWKSGTDWGSLEK